MYPPAVVLAQPVGHSAAGSGEAVMTVLLATVLIVIWATLGVVCWIFWRAKKREDLAKANEETTWSARSS